MSTLRCLLCICLISILLVGCGGTHQFRAEKTEPVLAAKQLPGTVSLKTEGIQEIYHHSLGVHKYELYVREAIQKQFHDSLTRSFAGGVKDSPAESNLVVTAIDTSVFPVAGVISDVRLFLRVEIFDHKMNLQKTAAIYGFGSSEEGSRAMEKASANAFRQLLPLLEEMYVRE